MKDKTITIRSVYESLLDDEYMNDLTIDRIVRYTVEFMRIVGVPDMFTQSVAKLDLVNYMAALPDDFCMMVQVRMSDNPKKVFRYSTDSFHMSHGVTSSDLTYVIQGGVLHANIPEGSVEVSYKSIATDDDGYPLIPDNSSFIRALEAYITLKYYKILFRHGSISGSVLSQIDQDYAWAVGDCATEFNRLSIDEMESFTNSWNNIVQKASSHRTSFANDGSRY